MTAGIRLCSPLLMVVLGMSSSLEVGAAEPVGAAGGEPPGVRLRWSAPGGCPGDGQMRARVERLLGARLSTPRAERVSTDLTVTGSHGKFVLVMTIDTALGSGERRLENDDCGLLADAAALIVALAIDPLAVMEHGQQTGAVRVTPPPTAPVAPKPTAPERKLRFGLRLTGGGAWGPLPKFGPGVAGGFGLLWRRARADVFGHYWFSQQARFAEPSIDSIGGDIRLWSVGLRGCPVLRAGKVEFPICAAMEVGAMYGEGVGVSMPHKGRSLWVAASAGPAVAWMPGQVLALWLGVDAVVPIVRPAFDVTNVDKELHRAQFVGVRALAGVEIRFP